MASSSGASTHVWRFPCAVALTGLAAGATGWVFSHLLHLVERLAFGVTSGTFLAGVEASAPWHRVAMLAISGAIGALSWFLLRRSGRAPVSVTDGVRGWRMPLLTTFWHATTQVVIVGLGASIGREVAPREMSAALSGFAADRLGLSAEDRTIIVACGAGAGLAAVYSIPLSGAVFALEVLLVRLSAHSVWPALAVSGIAVLVAHGWDRGEPFYSVPNLTPTASLVVWAVIAGPVIGALGHWFAIVVRRCERARPVNGSLLVWMPLTFIAIGALSIVVPSVLGNGQSTAQSAFDATAMGPLAVIVGAKALATLATIRSGAWGGTLTPGIALGAGLGALTGLAWSLVWPGTAVAAFAFIGAAVFLGASMHAPFTALTLVLEFTHQGAAILVPAVLAIGTATAVTTWLRGRETPPEHSGSSTH